MCLGEIMRRIGEAGNVGMPNNIIGKRRVQIIAAMLLMTDCHHCHNASALE